MVAVPSIACLPALSEPLIGDESATQRLPPSTTVPAVAANYENVSEVSAKPVVSSKPIPPAFADEPSLLGDVICNLAMLHRSRMNFVTAKVKIELQIKALQRQAHAPTCPKATHATCPGVYKIETPDILILREAALRPLEDNAQARLRAMLIECKALPAHVMAYVESIRGFGMASLAQIVAEAGDLSGYSNPAKLWKRMGVGLDNSAERPIRYEGRSPRRASIMSVIAGNFLKAGGPYKAYYDQVKEFERSKPSCGKALKNLDGTPSGKTCLDPEVGCCKAGHIHNRAMRKVAKRLLLNLWRVWRGQEPRPLAEEPVAA